MTGSVPTTTGLAKSSRKTATAMRIRGQVEEVNVVKILKNVAFRAIVVLGGLVAVIASLGAERKWG
jgi:hypothetical protein